LTDAEANILIDALNKTPNPCCGVCGPCKMYGPGAEDGPVCHCGKPSEYEAGLCGPCGLALGWRPPEGCFVEVAAEPARSVTTPAPKNPNENHD
jgi:hypothetical protein